MADLPQPLTVAIEFDRFALEQMPSAIALIGPFSELLVSSSLADRGKPIAPFPDPIVPGEKEILAPLAKKQICEQFGDS